MQARVAWVDGMSFVAESGSGHAVVIDGPPELGGRNIGARPMELLLMGVGACAAVDVVMILKKARQQVLDCACELKAERAETEPKVFTAVHLHFVITGKDLNASQIERAVALSADKYCSASIMLARGGVVMTHDFEIKPA